MLTFYQHKMEYHSISLWKFAKKFAREICRPLGGVSGRFQCSQNCKECREVVRRTTSEVEKDGNI